jgi:RNA polymerase sigma factor (sigma-70 family)
MNSAAEAFALQLSRASRQAMRFLRSRQLSKDARDDVIASAMLWCWENRDNYSLTTTLETWFVNAVRDAYRAYLRGERHGATEIVQEMGAKDDPEYNVVLQDAVRTLSSNMDEIDRAIVQLRLDDKTHKQIAMQMSLSVPTIERRLSKLRSQIPASAHVNMILRRVVTPPTTNNYDGDETTTEQGRKEAYPSHIDKEIAALDFPPPSGKECPPCWRCKYFEGYLPGEHRSVRMPIQESEVREAVLNTEIRKIEIAQEVRDGLL